MASIQPRPLDARSAHQPNTRSLDATTSRVVPALDPIIKQRRSLVAHRNPPPFLRTRLFDPLLAALGSNRPELRAELAISRLAGLAMTRYILRLEPLASARSDNVVNWLGPTVQRYLVELRQLGQRLPGVIANPHGQSSVPDLREPTLPPGWHPGH
jgi:hypothetical protein